MKKSDMRKKLRTVLYDRSAEQGEHLTWEEVDWLIDESNQLTDDELAECIGPLAVPLLRRAITLIA